MGPLTDCLAVCLDTRASYQGLHQYNTARANSRAGCCLLTVAHTYYIPGSLCPAVFPRGLMEKEIFSANTNQASSLINELLDFRFKSDTLISLS
ncbi:hypothetical protein PoB_007672700 [Plakobranchus ocellatus]|uniref:Uncharacterized protein n=1 Tax=Plakobranchus ocellatus TaxID=259542 RepID=A0AAV4E0X1_9GAST|nr:hypothetical protein PoB_007672700 [Plakobranchus ocellatus]